jgi:cell division protein FtsN
MTRDYKRPRKGTARSGGSLMAGILIGLLLGLIIALSVAWYINKMPSPFVSRNAPSTTPATPLGTVETPPAVPAAGTVAGNTDNGNSGNSNGKSRFDFYQILSGKQETTPPPPPTPQQQSTQQSAQQPQAAQRHPVQQQPVQPLQRQPVQAVAQTPPAHSAPGQFYLQAGSFRGGPEADNLKARLALLGIEADVQTATVPDQGVMHRVRIGPYSSADDANHARAQLSQNGIPTTVVKVAQ